jgi:hypothetical protein
MIFWFKCTAIRENKVDIKIKPVVKIINREQAIQILKKYSPMLDDEDLTEEMIDDITFIKK